MLKDPAHVSLYHPLRGAAARAVYSIAVLPYLQIGPLQLGTFGLFLWLAFMAAYFVWRRDLQRRRMTCDPNLMVGTIVVAGVAGAKLWHVLESPRELFDSPAAMLFSREGFAWFGGLLGGLLAILYFARHYKVPLLLLMDSASPAAALGYAVGRIGCLVSGDGDYGIPTTLPWGMSFPNGLVPTTDRVHPTPIYESIAGILLFAYLWRQGRKAVMGPRPQGQVVAEFFLYSGLAQFLVEFLRINPRIFWGMSNAQVMALASALTGLAALVAIKRRFKAQKGEHRILEHAQQRGDVLQPEYHRATPECPHPERWRMYDSMTAEVEVLEFLRCLVTTVKPGLIVETGTFMGISTLWLAEGLKQNGSGKVVTCEYDAKVFAKAQERFAASGLAEWIDARNTSSLDVKIEGTIDMLFSDSDPPLREQEVRRFLPQMSPHGIILMHDASSHLKTVREAALLLEQEGLISVILLPTPRGLVVAQKREGRK
jgi:prolipoprotein diacylglyceryl transferase